MTQMTEEQVEREVERRMNRLDAKLMNGVLTQRQYDDDVKQINKWAEASADRAAIWDLVRARSGDES